MSISAIGPYDRLHVWVEIEKKYYVCCVSFIHASSMKICILKKAPLFPRIKPEKLTEKKKKNKITKTNVRNLSNDWNIEPIHFCRLKIKTNKIEKHI